MNCNLEHIGFRDDPFLFWKFNVSDSFVEEIRMCDFSFLEKIQQFYSDFIDLSIKYNLGEILPVKHLGINIREVKEDYLKLSKEYFDKAEFVGFFPLINLKKYFPYQKYKKLHPNACLYNLVCNKNELHSDYFYLNKSGVRTLDSFNSWNLPHEQDTFEIHGFGSYLEYFDNVSKNDIGFSIEIRSEFWFEKVFWNQNSPSLKESVDNKWLAYHNTPRLNSFIRDLTQLWVDKYGWEFGYFEGWYESGKDGILLDGKIIYQEDIDEGRVELPDLPYPA